jgi:fructuronate reductase
MKRLSAKTLERLPASVRRPTYARERLTVGHVHIGVGAFHRCHQLEYVDDMLEARFGPWGVVGINMRPPRAALQLAPQDFLYTRTLREGARTETRVIGCLRAVIETESEASADAAVAALASNMVQLVTLTITEKGYGLTPASGALDADNSDVAADLAGAWPPHTALGLLARALEVRARDSKPITLMSCDNIPANGRRLRAGLMALLEAARPALVPWVEANVAFPGTMVDRIVPAARTEDVEALAATIGLSDEAAAFGEPFRQWVIEDRFAGARPPLDLAGAEFVADAEPYEQIKMRVLNAAQSTLSHWGALVGHEFSWQAATDGALAGLVERMLRRETLPTLPWVEGMATDVYLATSLARIRNSAIRHSCHQIGTDGSQKIVQRLLGPLRVRRARGLAAPDLECAVAGWIAYVAAGAKRYGARWAPDDPFAGLVIARAESADGFADLAKAALGISQIFGDDLADAGLAAGIAAHLEGLLGPDPHGHIRRTLARA